MSWKNLDKSCQDSAHYSVMGLVDPGAGMAALREMFPDGKANSMNAVLFSTSGVHGTYNTIEEAEARVVRGDAEQDDEVTFVIVQPRLVTLRYGNCHPENAADIKFLKKLRKTSRAVFASIGEPQ